MKYILYILLYLNIYTGFLYNINAQSLQLIIKGEDSIPKDLIDSLSLDSNYKNYLSLEQAAEGFHNTLSKIGYIENELKSIQKENDSVFTATYYFGTRFKFIKIYYSNEDFNKQELLQVSSVIKETYFILPFKDIESSLHKLNTLKTKNGNSFARLHLEEITTNKDFSLRARLILINGTKRTIDQIIIKGYDKFPMPFIKYYAGVRLGKTFSKEKIVSQSNSLNSLGFVSNIKPPEALFKKDSTTIYFYLKKQKNNLFDGILGFSTNEDSQKLIFNGYLNLELNNNLNFGEQFIINYKADGNEQQNFRAKVTIPYLLKSPFGAGLELIIFKRDSTFITTEQQARISYQINPATNSYVGYKGYKSSNLLDDAYEGTAVEDYNSKYIVIGASFKKYQENLLFPIKTIVTLETEIGSREQKELKESQLRIIGNLQYIFNLNYKNSIFIQNSTSILTSDSYITNELFRFGGINSIRGFNENSIDASMFSVLNSEYRYQFNEGVYLHSIIDIAYFENEVLSIKEKLYSFGIGIGMQTKAGILKLNFANGKAENQEFNFSNTKIHLSLSSRF